MTLLELSQTRHKDIKAPFGTKTQLRKHLKHQECKRTMLNGPPLLYTPTTVLVNRLGLVLVMRLILIPPL